MPHHELLLLVCPLLMFDSSRYVISGLALWCVDMIHDGISFFRAETPCPYSYCPSVCVVVAGLNEADGLERGLSNIWGTYPRLEIIVVDDGSSDGMSEVAHRFARDHEGIRVITKQRGGKSAAMNAALPLTSAEIIVIVDADSELGTQAIWEIVQPLRDARVAAVAGNVMVRNTKTNLLTAFQSFEFLRSILLGRMVSSRIGTLGIVSGAFGAFRKAVLNRVGGWDVGPGEDEDIVLRIRKIGYRIEFAPYAECYTDVPEKLKVLTKQRRRWEWAVVTFESRKHIDMALPNQAHFSWSNFFLFMERWVFNLVLPLWCWIGLGWIALVQPSDSWLSIAMLYLSLYAFNEFVLYLLILYYTDHKARDAKLIWVVPLLPFYQAYQRFVTTWAILEEMLTRRSFRDSFVPAHVRQMTWKW